MLINCSGDVFCNGEKLQNVNSFKYLGLFISNSEKAPFKMLNERL